jgi:hypothetical protein
MFQSQPPPLKVLELTYLPMPTPSSSEKLVTSKVRVAVMLSITNLDDFSGRICLTRELLAMVEMAQWRKGNGRKA